MNEFQIKLLSYLNITEEEYLELIKDVNINDFYWGLNNKFKLEIGLKNKINLNYPNIIWFK